MALFAFSPPPPPLFLSLSLSLTSKEGVRTLLTGQRENEKEGGRVREKAKSAGVQSVSLHA